MPINCCVRPIIHPPIIEPTISNIKITKKFKNVSKNDSKYIDYVCLICLNNYTFRSFGYYIKLRTYLS